MNEQTERYTKRITLSLTMPDDRAVREHIQAQPNMSAYLRDLVLADMAAKGSGAKEA